MMRVGLMAAVAAAGMAVLATPAEAGWRFTEWGMTPAEVVAAGAGKVVPRDPRVMAAEQAELESLSRPGDPPYEITCPHRLIEPLTIAEIAFDDVQFCYSKAGRLVGVSLSSDANVHAVASALTEALGPPVELPFTDVLPIWKFVDRERGNALSLRPEALYGETDKGSSLSYSALATGF